MRFFYLPIIACLALVGLVSCENKTSTVSQSSVAQIVSFAFTADDSIPGLGEAVFVVEELNDTGLIRMRKNDSVRYGTPIDSIVPSITYYTTPSSVTFYLGDSAVALTGYDTLDLRIRPIKIRVVAQNTDYEKWYNLKFDVHTVDGSLFHWDTICTNIPTANTHGTQKALMRNDIFYYYQNDGFRPRLFTSNNLGVEWQEQPLNGLPSTCNVRQIVEGQDLFFYGKGHDFYYSSNGIKWEHSTTKLDIIALYMCMNVKNYLVRQDSIRLWFAARDEQGSAHFYTAGTDVTPTIATGIGLVGDTLPANFPIEDFATVPFQSSSLLEHGLIAGGYNRDHQMTNTRWSLEYNYISNAYHLSNMASRDRTFPCFSGSSVCYYNDFLYMLGGIHEDRSFVNNVYTSDDEGTHWTEISDSTNYHRPAELKGRYHTNTFVHDGNIYIIGGEDHSTTYSDVYRGRQNSVNWPAIGD